LIPKTNLYKDSRVDPAHSRADVETLLEKFNVKKFMWKRDEPENSFVVFAKPEEFSGNKTDIAYKVTIPFIEKTQGRHKDPIYDEKRSYRILFHILKHQLLNTDVGMEFEQVFGNYIVVGKLPSGEPMNAGEQIGNAIVNNKLPSLPEFTQ